MDGDHQLLPEPEGRKSIMERLAKPCALAGGRCAYDRHPWRAVTYVG
jgi:hypothetical protein